MRLFATTKFVGNLVCSYRKLAIIKYVISEYLPQSCFKVLAAEVSAGLKLTKSAQRPTSALYHTQLEVARAAPELGNRFTKHKGFSTCGTRE